MTVSDKRKEQQKQASASYRAKAKARMDKLIATLKELIAEYEKK